VAVVEVARNCDVTQPSRLSCQTGILPVGIGRLGSLPDESGRDA